MMAEKTFYLLTSFWLLSFLVYSAADENCRNPQDVVFLLDGSTSVGIADFVLMKQYVKNFTKIFNRFGPDATQVSIIQFSNKSAIVEEIRLDQYTDRDELERAILNIQYLEGVTYTGEALKYMMEVALSPSHGSRLGKAGIHTVAIVITDGESHDHHSVIHWQAVAKAHDVELFAIGIGRRLKDAELLLIASDPKETHKFNVENFLALKEAHKMFSLRDICDRIQIQCRTPQDIIFLLDGSASVSTKNFILMKNYVKNFTKMYQRFGPDATQVGVIQFAKTIKEEILLNQYTEREDLERAIENITYLRGRNTYTGSAIKYMVENALTSSRGSRLGLPGIRSVVMILTDGKSRDKPIVSEWKPQAEARGVDMFAIGIGNKINEVDLEKLVSEPKASHLFRAENFLALEQALMAFSGHDICECVNRIDIIFILDGSPSVSARNFKQVKNWLKPVVVDMSIDNEGVRVGVVQYSHFSRKGNEETYVNTVVPLQQYRDSKIFNAAIKPIKRLRRRVDAADLMDDTFSFHYIGLNISYPVAKRVFVLVTYAESVYPSRLSNLLKKAEMETGAMIYTVGIGDIGAEGLRLLSTNQIDRVFGVSGVSNLNTITSDLQLQLPKLCDCHPEGKAEREECDTCTRQCKCKKNVVGLRCDECVDGHYDFGNTEGCLPCKCNPLGSIDYAHCNVSSGQCNCRSDAFQGRNCGTCATGYFGFPECGQCQCNGYSSTCHQETGVCENCANGRQGEHCDICPSGHYLDQERSDCVLCLCNGNIDVNDPEACNPVSGECIKCLNNTIGFNCEQPDEPFDDAPFQPPEGYSSVNTTTAETTTTLATTILTTRSITTNETTTPCLEPLPDNPCLYCNGVPWPSYCHGWLCRRRWPHHKQLPSIQRCNSGNLGCRAAVKYNQTILNNLPYELDGEFNISSYKIIRRTIVETIDYIDIKPSEDDVN